MKKYLLIIITILTLEIGYSQYCGQNTIPGSTIIEFDWTTEYFDMYLKDEFQQNYYAQVSSPFYITNNSAQFNTDHFAETLELDFEPENGWEIIYFNFGTPQEGVAEPSYALYNRYNGLFRFFMYLTANGENSYQEAYISTYIKKLGQVFKNSALMESQNAIHHSLENFEKQVNIDVVNRYNESYGTWIVSEWLTHYDPCTCISSMTLVLEPTLQNISYVTLESDGSTNTIPIYSNMSNSNSGSVRVALGSAGGFAEKISGAYKKGNEVYKNFDAFTNTLEQISEGQTFDSEYKSPGILNNISNIASGAASGNPIALIAGLLSIVNTFSTSSSSKTITSYSSKHEFSTSGTIQTDAPYQAAEVYIPGSDHDTYPGAKKPIYNNILGIASIIETPTIETLTTTIQSDYGDDCPPYDEWAWASVKYNYYKMNEDDIKFAINTNADIKNVPKEAKVALYFQYDLIEQCNAVNFNELEEIEDYLIKVNNNLYRTPYMNLSCLKNYPIVIPVQKVWDCAYYCNTEYNVTPYLQLAMILESNDGKEIGQIKSYKIRYDNPNYDWESRPENNFLEIPEDITINYHEIDENTETWGSTTVTDVPQNGVDIKNPDGSHSWFVLNDGDPSTPDDIYITDQYTIDCGIVNPVDQGYLQSFCNSSKYNPVVAISENNHNQSLNNKELTFRIYPNPTIDFLSIELEDYTNTLYEISDLLGSNVKSGNLSIEKINISELTSGMYVFRIIRDQKLIADEKIIKL